AWICGEVTLNKDNIQMGDYLHGFVSMSGKPQETTPRAIELLTAGLGFSDVRVTLSIRRLDKNVEMEKIRSKRSNSMGRLQEPLNMLDRIKNPNAKASESMAGMNVEAKDEIE